MGAACGLGVTSMSSELTPVLRNAIYAQATPKERKVLARGKLLEPSRMHALAIDAALAQPKGSGGRHLADALVRWAAKNIERSF
jgi:hypothetical protein